MKSRDRDYYHASLERSRQADALASRDDSYALAIYCGGLAVECLLRAFRWRDEQGFEGRHNLEKLLKASRILGVHEDWMRRRGKSEEDVRKSSIEFRQAMNEIAVLWHNNLRFASEARLKAYLADIDRVQGIKGDPLKKNAMDFMNAVQLVVRRGMKLWLSQTK